MAAKNGGKGTEKVGILLCLPAPNRSLHTITLSLTQSSPSHLIFTEPHFHGVCTTVREVFYVSTLTAACLSSGNFSQKDNSVCLCKLDMKCLACTVFAQEKLHPARKAMMSPFKERSVLQKGQMTKKLCHKICTRIQKKMEHCTVIAKGANFTQLTDRVREGESR